MQPFVVRSSRRGTILLILACVAFVAVGLWMAIAAPESRRFSAPTTRVVGAASVLLGGVGFVALARRMVGPTERIVIDDAGIHDRDMRVGVIPWNEVAGAFSATIHRQEMICLALHHEDAWLAKLPALRRAGAATNRRMGLTPFVLGFSATDRSAAEALDVITRELERRAIPS